jgi:hypothetical protein
MTRAGITIGMLTFALLLSNGFWLYHAIDSGVTATHRDVSFQDHRVALTQALAILPAAAARDATPQAVLAAAEKAAGETDSFEKDGFIWIGRLGLKFATDGRLVDARPAWSPF